MQFFNGKYHSMFESPTWCLVISFKVYINVLMDSIQSSAVITRSKIVRYYVDNYRTLRWRHNDHAGVSNHQPHGCLLNRLFRRKSKKTSKLRVTGLCAGNSPGTGEFPAQMASYAENVSIWWRHHELRRNISQILDPQKHPMWVYFVNIGEKINHVRATPHCI